MEQDGAGVQSLTRRRIMWTNEMNAALITCKKNAQLLVKYNESTLAENRLLISGPKVKEHLKKADMEKLKEKLNEEKWHGRLLQAKWQDSRLIQ